MVDKTLILRKFTELDESLGQLSEFSSVSVAEYSKDWKVQRIVERTLQIMIEICVDVANHIIADKKFRAPSNYADTFEVLADNNVLSRDLLRTMQEMAKFRNVIVHGYDKVDAGIVVNILNGRLKDFADYRDAVISHLE